MESEITSQTKFAETDQLDLPAEALAQAGATIKRNLEIPGYGE